MKLWDRAARRWVASFPWDPRAQNWGLAFSPNGSTLAAVRRTGKVTLWARGRAWDDTTTVVADPGPISLRGFAEMPMAFSPDGKTLAASSGNGITLFNVASRQGTLSLKGHTGTAYATAFSPDGNTLASGSPDGTVRLWHAATRREFDPLRVVLRGAADRAVTMQWRPLPDVAGYHVYRGPENAAPRELARLMPQPLAATSFTDHGLGLVNGRPLTYGIAPVYRDTAGKIEEGDRVIFPAIPGSTPPGFTGYSIDEGSRSGWALFDPPGDCERLE